VQFDGPSREMPGGVAPPGGVVSWLSVWLRCLPVGRLQNSPQNVRLRKARKRRRRTKRPFLTQCDAMWGSVGQCDVL
jgi:hypothetical protein